MNDTTFKFDTNEQYTFYSHEDPTIDYDYKKTYTIQSSSDSYIIKTIESEKISEEEYDE
ncbi:TcaA NTF2-like domain-containing protein [Rummeliibacillus suwonensis]|uniref:TcaA NTF2-like domain-containing protein n=1 Tax=Rummeliibacillus suwonensis TaxID=1306154 RepID=UPI003CC815C4